ncbi:MAG: trigger factor [Cardiobacteriaceae bacterium]|nr:trigger factor [Cardiobacteriaceae bacterium]
MQTTFETLEGLVRKLTIEVPAQEVEQGVEKRLRAERPSIRVAGFRKGKVPPEILKQKFGAEIRQRALGDLIDESYRKALVEGQHTPAAAPEIELFSGVKEGENLKFAATFEIVPEVVVKGLDGLALTLTQTEITDADVEEMLKTLQRQQGQYIVDANHAADSNDRVTIDFVGRLNGEAFEGGSGNDVPVVIGAGQMLPDFENGLRGVKAGEEKVFEVNFPEQYHAENLAGKKTEFTAQVKKVERLQLPEINNEFAKRFGIAGGDLEAFKKAIRDNMVRELGNAERRIKRERLFDALVAANSEQAIPNSQVAYEVERMAKNINLEKQIPDAEQRKQLAQTIFGEQARRHVLLSLLLGKLFAERNIQLDAARVEERLNTIASTYEKPEEVKAWYRKDQNARNSLASAVLEEQLIDSLCDAANISYEAKTFQEVMQINNQLPR